jgi:hypothetical protein
VISPVSGVPTSACAPLGVPNSWIKLRGVPKSRLLRGVPYALLSGVSSPWPGEAGGCDRRDSSRGSGSVTCVYIYIYIYIYYVCIMYYVRIMCVSCVLPMYDGSVHVFFYAFVGMNVCVHI